MFILTSIIACCLVLDEGLDLWPPLCLTEETLLLRFQRLMTKLLSQSINWYTFVSIYLSSSTAHGLVPIFGPFFPIIAPQNSTFLLLREKKKKKGFWFLAIVLPTLKSLLSMQVSFQPQKGTLLALWHLRHFSIYFILRPIPHVLRCDEEPTVEKFYGDFSGSSPLTFPIPIYIARRFWLFYFLHLKLSRTSPRSLSIFS